MDIGKRGFLMTLFAIILSSFFIVMFSSRITVPPDQKVELIQSRIMLLDHYSDNFFNYAKGVTVISGYSALQGILNDTYTTRKYNPNFESEYILCISKGNMTSSKLCPGMAQKNLEFYLDNLTSSAKKELKINSKYIINNMTLAQTEDPFYLEVNINMTLNISDQFAEISNNRLITSYIPIIGILDPLYLLNGTYNQTIQKYKITKKEGSWTPQDMRNMYIDHEYRFSGLGISFIQRMQGNFTNTSMGIESIVNHTRADVLSRYSSNNSLIDYFFWRNISFDCLNMKVVNITKTAINNDMNVQKFQLDDVHRVSFNISNSNTTITNGCRS